MQHGVEELPAIFQFSLCKTTVGTRAGEGEALPGKEFSLMKLAIYSGSGGKSCGLGRGNFTGFRITGFRFGKGRAVGVDGVGIVGTKAQLFESAGIRSELGLPTLIGLKLLHGGNGGAIPIAGGIAGEVVLADEGLLNLDRAGGIDTLLAMEFRMPGLQTFTRFCARPGYA